MRNAILFPDGQGDLSRKRTSRGSGTPREMRIAWILLAVALSAISLLGGDIQEVSAGLAWNWRMDFVYSQDNGCGPEPHLQPFKLYHRELVDGSHFAHLMLNGTRKEILSIKAKSPSVRAQIIANVVLARLDCLESFRTNVAIKVSPSADGRTRLTEKDAKAIVRTAINLPKLNEYVSALPTDERIRTELGAQLYVRALEFAHHEFKLCFAREHMDLGGFCRRHPEWATIVRAIFPCAKIPNDKGENILPSLDAETMVRDFYAGRNDAPKISILSGEALSQMPPSPPATNAFVKTLYEFRRPFRMLRANDCLMRELYQTLRARNQTSPRGAFGLQRAFGDPDVLTVLLTPLKHLRIESPWKLDAEMRGLGGDGASTFYLRDGNRVRDAAYLLDGTPESAWERVLIEMAAGQLMLAWHGNYGNLRIITDIARFADEANCHGGGETALERFTPEMRATLAKIDFTPTVSLSGGVATVRFYVFSPFEGFLLMTCRVDMKTGEMLGKHPFDDHVCVVRYWCGIRY